MWGPGYHHHHSTTTTTIIISQLRFNDNNNDIGSMGVLCKVAIVNLQHVLHTNKKL